MLDASDAFLAALRSSHRATVRAGVWLPDDDGLYQRVGTLGVVDGQLTLDYRRNIRRQASLTVASANVDADYDYATRLDTRDYLEALTTSSAELSIEWGLVYPGGSSEYITLGRVRVEEATRTLASRVEITSAYDGGSRVEDFTFVTPYAPYDIDGVKLTYVQAIQDLVDTSYPSTDPPVWVIGSTVDLTSLPPDGTAFDGSRWTAVNDLAKAINCVVGVDANGHWRIDTAPTPSASVWTVDTGAYGVLVSETTTYSRREQFNAVGIRWELPDGSGGLAYIVDSDPASPTYYDGPFGRKPRPEETVSTITTSDQAIAHATSVLEQSKGVTRGISLVSVHNPLLEPYDVITVDLGSGVTEDHVIDSITLPLAGGTTTMETRIVREAA